MYNQNNIAPDNSIDDMQYKLSDFISEFNEFRSSEIKSSIGCESIDNNLVRLEKKSKIRFENRIAICPECNSYNSVRNGTVTRKLVFLRIREKNCIVQKYKCKKCGKTFFTDLSFIVAKNSNITIPVIDKIHCLYRYFKGSLHKNT